MLIPGTLFEELGFTYFGPLDGHDIAPVSYTHLDVYKRQKLTYVTVYGLQEAKHAAQRLATEASVALANFDEAAEPLTALACYAIQRKY